MLKRAFGTDSWLRFAVLMFAVALLPGCADKPDDEIDAFLARHWTEPLPPQGTPPRDFSHLEASLSPESCAQCHAKQYEGWSQSLHSRAMGPGLRWQLMLMNQEQGNRCLRCHAPLAEQKALVAIEHGWPNAPQQPPPDFVPRDMGHRGLTCAACHVRGHERFGPAPREAQKEGGPHGGFKASAAFSDSRFCAHCHQFPDDGPRIAGKLQEDTYAQWRASAYAKIGAEQTTCQGCHMPDRAHKWRGIHDPDMTRRAIDVSLVLEALPDGRQVAVARVHNRGAGHHFPTYMVPKVELVFVRHDDRGRVELGRQFIGWQVDTPITHEIADTRIPAGETREFQQPFSAPPDKPWWVELIVQVLPAEHYERIYRSSLARSSELPAPALPLLRQALTEAEATRYELLRVEARHEPQP